MYMYIYVGGGTQCNLDFQAESPSSELTWVLAGPGSQDTQKCPSNWPLDPEPGLELESKILADFAWRMMVGWGFV